jgi:glycerol uptake facilitator-like aquaporin
MATESHKRNRLAPWFVGLLIILAGVIFVGYRMQASNCGISFGLELLVLAIMPAVYLVLMYLTLTSQE